MAARPAQPNRSLADGIDLLLALVNAGGPVGVRELARRVGMETTRCQRLVATLAWQGMAEQTADRKYRPGPGIHVLSTMSVAASGLLRRALPHLRSLHGAAPIVALGVLWRDEMCYLYHGSGRGDDDQALGRMTHFPAVRSGLGMALLADRAEAELDRHLGDAVTAKLRRDLARVRERGYAVVDQRSEGVRSLGVTIGDPGYAALGLSGTFDDAVVPDLVDRLHVAARAIEGD